MHSNFIRLKILDSLIKNRCTGTPSELAEKLGISEEVLPDFFAVIQTLGVTVKYCKESRSYHYKESGLFNIQLKPDK